MSRSSVSVRAYVQAPGAGAPGEEDTTQAVAETYREANRTLDAVSLLHLCHQLMSQFPESPSVGIRARKGSMGHRLGILGLEFWVQIPATCNNS